METTRLPPVLVTALSLVLGTLALVWGFVSSAGATLAAETGTTFVARIGHLESPDQARHEVLAQVARQVAEQTGGAVSFMLYPSGQLGTQADMLDAVQKGSLEATVAPAAFASKVNPACGILDLPGAVPSDPAAAAAIRQGAFGRAVLQTFDQRGLHGVALWPNGRKHFTANVELDGWKDFQGRRFRVMNSPILIAQVQALGATAVPLPFREVKQALHDKAVDGQENPLDTILNMGFYEDQVGLLLSDHAGLEDVVLFNPAWWNSLPETWRQVIVRAFEDAAPLLEQRKAAEAAQALDALKKVGLVIRDMTPERRHQFRTRLRPSAEAAYLDTAGQEGAVLLRMLMEAEMVP